MEFHLPDTMKAMVFEQQGRPLVLHRIRVPAPGPGQVLVKVIACGICRTDLHILDGDLKHPKLPLIPGHEIVGEIAALGTGVKTRKIGQFIGIPWLAHSCGNCRYCRKGKENLCENALFTGYTFDGGFAEYCLAYESYCFPIDQQYADASGAPLLCAGLIGYRAYRMTGNEVHRLGIYGFGAAAHLLIQLARHRGQEIYAFTRPGDLQTQAFARRLGARWAGGSDENSPEPLDAAIIFAPVGALVPKALRDTDKGGAVICGGIHMSDIPSFPYSVLWEERVIRSVANLSRRDGLEYLALAPEVPVQANIQTFPLGNANEAIDLLRQGAVEGAAVLVMSNAGTE